MKAAVCVWDRTVSTILRSSLKSKKIIVRLRTPLPCCWQVNKCNDELNMLGEMIGEQDIEPLLQAANSDSEDAQSARRSWFRR